MAQLRVLILLVGIVLEYHAKVVIFFHVLFMFATTTAANTSTTAQTAPTADTAVVVDDATTATENGHKDM